MKCIIDAMQRSKRNPTPMIYYSSVVMIYLLCVALLDSLHNKVAKDFRLSHDYL
jgi:hypothetical protein